MHTMYNFCQGNTSLLACRFWQLNALKMFYQHPEQTSETSIAKHKNNPDLQIILYTNSIQNKNQNI